MPAASRRRSTKRTPRFIVRDAIKQALAYRRKHRDKMISFAAIKILFDERSCPFSEYCGSAYPTVFGRLGRY
jgi:hypothetical protein